MNWTPLRVCQSHFLTIYSFQQLFFTYIMSMNEFDSSESLPEPLPDCVFVEAVGKPLQIIENCSVDELEDEVKPLLPTKHFEQVHQVLVAKLLREEEEQQLVSVVMLVPLMLVT